MANLRRYCRAHLSQTGNELGIYIMHKTTAHEYTMCTVQARHMATYSYILLLLLLLLLLRLRVPYFRGEKARCPVGLSGRHLPDIKPAELSFSMPPALMYGLVLHSASLLLHLRGEAAALLQRLCRGRSAQAQGAAAEGALQTPDATAPSFFVLGSGRHLTSLA